MRILRRYSTKLEAGGQPLDEQEVGGRRHDSPSSCGRKTDRMKEGKTDSCSYRMRKGKVPHNPMIRGGQPRVEGRKAASCS